MFNSWKEKRSRPKSGIKNGTLLASSPTLISVEDILRLYDFSGDLVIAGALCDAFLHNNATKMSYESWKKALDSRCLDNVCRLVIEAFEASFEKMDKSTMENMIETNPAGFILRMAILINTISKLPSLSDEEIEEWKNEVVALMDFNQKNISPEFAKIYKEIHTHFKSILFYISTVEAAG